jgi:hypothetical protein
MSVVVQKEDYKYYKENPNYNFKRSQAIIQETIESTKKFFNQLGRKIDDEGHNRVDMVSSYGVYRFKDGEKKFRQFIGERRWKDLIGEKVLEKIRIAKTVNKLNGNTKFMDYYLK